MRAGARLCLPEISDHLVRRDYLATTYIHDSCASGQSRAMKPFGQLGLPSLNTEGTRGSTVSCRTSALSLEGPPCWT